MVDRIKEWIAADDEKKRKLEFKHRLKYGKHWGGTTVLNPGQQITVKNGRIIVR